MRGSRLRCVMNRTDTFFFGLVKPQNLGFSKKNAWFATSSCHEPDGHFFFGLVKPQRTSALFAVRICMGICAVLKMPCEPIHKKPSTHKNHKTRRRLTTTHQRDTRRSGCGNGRNACNTGPSPSSKRISGIARKRSTSTTITSSTTPRPSEHSPVRGGKLSKRLGGIVGCKYKISS